MATKDKRIDTYIAKSPLFAQPILTHMRILIHKACPEVIETIKWGMPFFDYKGPMFNFAAFKAHCVGGFWKAKLLKDEHNYLGERKNNGGEAMGHLGRMTSLKDLPPDKVLIDFIKQHMKLNETGINVEKKVVVKKELVLPQELEVALSKNKKAQTHFEQFTTSQKGEYADWIAEAKTAATKQKRLADAVEWISEGKIRNWKYLKK
ncbi:MAG: YdeI/OmpD-associated family protein [Bacteroidetes bacterium]|nr:YdeI/OmpD-associated family protein [Bacteroidota bacterium]MBK9798885.1 YdeI/OmpD-associated family protein [Bacteroidota bacterium]MBP6412943.1 YdeI/OmpD-associated family protein [Bacteroidia bacterium]